ncbi:MAG TPA: FlgO family outer membrane protein [Candidatus Kapabacteria bacterium]|nr:FlgO family outer membrane protein [Candidatus Kapabacteria bacterium]
MSTTLSSHIANSGKKTIAVVDFTDLQGNVTELGRFFAEEFSVTLASEGKGFEVIDRTHLKTLLAEHKLSSTGIIDQQTAKKLGQIAGVDSIITGNITPFGDTVRLTIKILDTSTAKVIGATSGDIAKTKAIEDLLAKGIGGSVIPLVPPVTSSPQGASQQSPINSQLLRVQSKGFTLQLIECRRKLDTTVVCELLITSEEKNQELSLYAEQRKDGTCRLFDNFGNEYYASNVVFGNNSSSDEVRLLLISSVPTKAIVKFEGVLREATSATLDIGVVSDYWKYGFWRVPFRNIPIAN